MSILATSTYIIGISKEDITLNYILCTYHLIYFWKYNNNINILINLNSKPNIITLVYILKLSL